MGTSFSCEVPTRRFELIRPAVRVLRQSNADARRTLLLPCPHFPPFPLHLPRISAMSCPFASTSTGIYKHGLRSVPIPQTHPSLPAYTNSYSPSSSASSSSSFADEPSFSPSTSPEPDSKVLAQQARCPFTGAVASEQQEGSGEAVDEEEPEAKRAALKKRIEDEVTGGLLVHSGDVNGSTGEQTLYLPPLLSLLPSHLSNLAAPSSTLSSTPIGLSPVASAPQPVYTLTRLPSIDAASLALHSSLHAFRPITPHYATAAYAEAFNWSELSIAGRNELEDAELVEREREFYCVVFRSRRRQGLREEEARELYEKDRAAHEEAVSVRLLPLSPSFSTSLTSLFLQWGGLLFYFYSSPVASLPESERNAGLATCIWASRADAVKALRGPKHAEAVRLAQRAYESFTLERYILRKEPGDRALRVVPWHGGEVLGLEEE